MQTKDFDFNFDDTAAKYSIKKYYDEIVQADIKAAGPFPTNVTEFVFPNIDSKAFLVQWGISFYNIAIAQWREAVQTIIGNVRITLLVNERGVPGYTGLDFPPSSWLDIEQAATPVLAFSHTVMTPAFLVPINFPIFQNNSTLQINVENLALAEDTYMAIARIRGFYVS